MAEYKHLKRLERVWVKEPVFFITTCTHHRQAILANAQVAKILVEEWQGALERHGWMVGRYVIMPDHVHFFCAPVAEIGNLGYNDSAGGIGDTVDGMDHPIYKTLSAFMQQWKQWTSKRMIRECRDDCSPDGPSGLQRLQPPIWQAEFFDHLLRSHESYSQKWEYVRQNPMRAGLVTKFEDWPWQGEIYNL